MKINDIITESIKRQEGVAEGQSKGEYGRVLDALQLYYPRIGMTELNVPGYHKVIANKANVPVEYAAQVINNFVKANDPNDEEWPEDDDQSVAENDLRGSALQWGSKVKNEIDPEGKSTKFVPKTGMYRVHTGATAPDQVKRDIQRRSAKGGVAGPRGVLPEQGMSEGAGALSVQQLATISDEALDNAYHYGRSTPGNTFGWQANLMSAAYAKRMIEAGVTDIEKISDAIHKGWNVTAQKFVQDPSQFDDSAKLQAAGKLEAKLQQRAQLMKQNYAQLPDEEQEKDRVVARALLQAIRGSQGVAEGTGNLKPGWMLKQDPELAKKVKDSKRGHEARKKWAGKMVPKDGEKGVTEAGASTASFRRGNDKRAQLNAMTPEERRAYDQEQQEKQRKRDDARLERERNKNKGVAEGRFDKRDAYQRDLDSSQDFGSRQKEWDEGDTEPANNFAIYINGKKWKVFKGEGYHADDHREKQQHQRLKDMCAKKTATSGKKWEVYVTGESPTLEEEAPPTQVQYGMPGFNDEQVDETIRKIGDDKYRLYSGKDKNLGTFPSKSGAEKHEREVQYFKHKK